jgi:ferritin
MLISNEMTKKMNAQIGSELGASNQYLRIAAYFDSEDLPELATFFFRQSDEERMHALKFVHYVLEAGGEIEIPAIPLTPGKVPSAKAAVQMALDWEMEVTSQINDIMALAVEQNDFIAQQFLHWFVGEQLEEVSTMSELVSVIDRAGDQLLLVEEYIARRGDPHAVAAE